MDASGARPGSAATWHRRVGTTGYRDGMNPDELPSWSSVLVVVAHPDDESFGLGGILGAFAAAGAAIEVLCLTQGEASTLGGRGEELVAVRRAELALAAERLGVGTTTLLDLPDGHLRELGDEPVRQPVRESVGRSRPDGVLVFDPEGGVTGHPDHEAASRAALAVADAHGIPVLGWALPTAVARALNADGGGSFVGHDDLDLTVRVDRLRQSRAIEAHASQAVPGSVLWRRLELLGPFEHLRWLRPRAR